MQIIYSLEAQEGPNPHQVSARPLHQSEHVQVTMVTLQPGESLKLHSTPVDVFFYILEGGGIVEIGGEQQEVSRDMLVVSPARIPHRLMNPSEEVFRFLVVKTPAQKEKTRIL
ncbi:MAG TPA: cupin domain-containing protein [Chloroflexi bacterium]|jgi:mannose-6-phosphate isomerase-like protein (cupin superfamily)|nr:cupin domain-containing protein [Chloroflexota bacterium]